VVPVRGAFFLKLHLDVVGDLSPATMYFNDQPQWTAPAVAGALGIDAGLRSW
jgi:hypothetical protein